MKHKTVSVVIPSWNSQSQMKQNLPYVFAAAGEVSTEIIVVDDCSTSDSSVKYLKSLGNKIQFFENKNNLGYGETVNRGVSYATGDVIVLLNTDVRPSKDCFVKALKYFEDETIYALNFNSGEDWMGGEWKDGLFHHFRVKPTLENKNKVNPSLWASGGQGAFSKSKWMQLRGMDPIYKPFYWEDTDMGFNAWKRGWKVLWAPECKVEHDHQSSVIASNFTNKFVTTIAQRNQFLFVWKNVSDPQFLLSHIIRLPYFLFKFPIAFAKAIALLPQVVSKRTSTNKYWEVSDRDILKLWTR